MTSAPNATESDLPLASFLYTCGMCKLLDEQEFWNGEEVPGLLYGSLAFQSGRKHHPE